MCCTDIQQADDNILQMEAVNHFQSNKHNKERE